MILDADMPLNPGAGPSDLPFDPNRLCEIHVDSDFGACADVTFAFSFRTQGRLPEAPGPTPTPGQTGSCARAFIEEPVNLLR